MASTLSACKGAGRRILPAIDIYWAPQNNTSDCNGQPNPLTGALGTTFYVGGTIPASSSCPATQAGMYVLGDADGTSNDVADEFDSSVIAHEFGHYYEDALSRSDSIGGPHSLDGRHDLTLAFSEGFCNAFHLLTCQPGDLQKGRVPFQ